MAENVRHRHARDRETDLHETATSSGFTISRSRRSIRPTSPSFRWECPCQEPAVMLATYDPEGRINIKVRDRYWHLYGFGQVQAICPKCAAEHLLDLRQLHDALDNQDDHSGPD